MTAPLLTPRALNRATLARQHLLDRAPIGPLELTEQLVGLQAQTPQSWYPGFWTRLRHCEPAAVGELLEQRALVRVTLMRGTIHLVTATDALALRPLLQPVIDRMVQGSFGRHARDLDRADLVAAAHALTAAEPLAPAELGRLLAERFPRRDPDALAQLAKAWLPLVQVPPRGVWRRSGRPRHAPLDLWLSGTPVPAVHPVEGLVLRYLAAFGPATVRDVQVWCGLTRLAEVLDGLRARLVAFRDEAGHELFDLPEAPRPGPDAPAPVRFLYDFDNLLLSHADRSRVLPPDAVAVYSDFGARNVMPAAVLVDGTVAATWTTATARGAAVLTVRPVRPISGAERDAVAAEGTALLAFLHPGTAPDVRFC